MQREIIIPTDVRIRALDSVLDPEQRRDLIVPVGASIADMVAQAYPLLPAARHGMIRATIGDQVVMPEVWARVRPKPGTQVLLRLIPAGDTLRNVLTIAVTVAALAAGQGYAPTLLSAFGASGTLATSAAQFAITGSVPLAGCLCLNALAVAHCGPSGCMP